MSCTFIVFRYNIMCLSVEQIQICNNGDQNIKKFQLPPSSRSIYTFYFGVRKSHIVEIMRKRCDTDRKKEILREALLIGNTKRKKFLNSLKRSRFSRPSVWRQAGCGNYYLLTAYSSCVSRRMSTVYRSLCKRRLPLLIQRNERTWSGIYI